MYISAKMIPVETIPEWGKEDKGERGGGEI
jgi:hypothetical protein